MSRWISLACTCPVCQQAERCGFHQAPWRFSHVPGWEQALLLMKQAFTDIALDLSSLLGPVQRSQSSSVGPNLNGTNASSSLSGAGSYSSPKSFL